MSLCLSYRAYGLLCPRPRGEKVIPRPQRLAFKRRAIGLTAAILGTELLCPGESASVTLAWNPVTSGGVTGYRVYHGTRKRARIPRQQRRQPDPDDDFRF